MGFHMRHVRKKMIGGLNLNYTFYYSHMFLYYKKASKSLNFKPLFPYLKVITEIYDQSQMNANFWCFYIVRRIFFINDFKNEHFSAFCYVNSVKK
jgi:hypothetical protein